VETGYSANIGNTSIPSRNAMPSEMLIT